MYAESGRQGLECVRRASPDAVVLDLDIPEMRTKSILQELRRFNGSQPLIVLSENGTGKNEKWARTLGVTEFIEKRVAPHRLVKILGCMFNDRRPEKTPTPHWNQVEISYRSRSGNPY
jgi:DNA-binding response OmpR family regulator